MASTDTRSQDSQEPSLHETCSTAVDRIEACLQNDTPDKYATIVDINANAQHPRSGLTFARPAVDELLWKGPSQIMNDAGSHRTDVRWIHLRSNCMAWVEELMDKICEERGMDFGFESEEIAPDSPTWRKNPILRKDLWSHLFHGKHSDRIETRFMGPACTAFSLEASDEESDGTGSTRGSRDNLVMYLPYMHWESSAAWRSRQALLKSVSSSEGGEAHADRDFVSKYLHHDTSPYHERRSLEEAYYHDFGMTAAVDSTDQVMERHIRHHRREEPKLIVIDQLWLWLIRGFTTDNMTIPDLVITAFPDRFNGAHDSANVYRGIIAHLERGLQPALRKPEDLIACIIEHCTGVFFQRQLEHDKWFLEFFAGAIGSVRQHQRLAYRDFCTMCIELETLQTQRASLVEVSQVLEHGAFAITQEATLFREIKDIVDELARIDYILSQQENVVKTLTRSTSSTRRAPRTIQTTHDIVSERRAAWAAIALTARTAYDEIQAQMDLKQKQASLSEIRSSRYHAEDSARHGRIMLLFTIVTIIFLPMSFMASWFGMNPETPALGDLRLSSIAAIIFPLSLAITGVTLVLTFSEGLREGLVAVLLVVRRALSWRGLRGGGSGGGSVGSHGGLGRARHTQRRRRWPSWDQTVQRTGRSERGDNDVEMGTVR